MQKPLIYSNNKSEHWVNLPHILVAISRLELFVISIYVNKYIYCLLFSSLDYNCFSSSVEFSVDNSHCPSIYHFHSTIVISIFSEFFSVFMMGCYSHHYWYRVVINFSFSLDNFTFEQCLWILWSYSIGIICDNFMTYLCK